MRNIRFGLAIIAVCGLIVLAAGIRVAIWAHQAEAISAGQEFVADRMLVLRRTMAGLLELDSTERGYLLTGDAADLKSYDQARRDLVAALNRLDALFRDEPAQTADIAKLATLAHAAEDEAARMVKLAGEGRRADALDAASAANGRHLMAAFRSALNSLFDPLRREWLQLRPQQVQKFHDIYILMALVVLVVDLLIVVAFVSLSVSIYRLRGQQQARERQAMYDPLTQLPNRRYLGEWLAMTLAAARRSDRNLALLYLDLDGFKSVNDRFGHETGDRVLQITATRLRQSLRLSDFVARLGGDEFVAVLPDVQTAPGVSVLVERLQAEIGKAPIAEMDDGAVGASIGAAWFPTDGATADTLLAAADRAMYEVKLRHRAWRSRHRAAPRSEHGPPQSAMT